MRAVVLERDRKLHQLQAALADAAGGSGSAVLVCGEVGVGKTSGVRAFVRGVAGGVRVFAGV